MAITSRKIRFQSRVTGGGFDSNGNPVQGKTLVVGVLAGAYVTGGATCYPEDLGLTAIDSVFFRVTTPAAAAGTGTRVADFLSNKLLLHDPDGETQEGNATDFVVEYMALGDSAVNVESL